MAMDDGLMAPAATKEREMAAYMPHEIVSQILTLLPVRSLMRLSCVCKAWQSTICGDPSFHLAHLRLQKPCLLVSPHTRTDDHRDMGKVGLSLYRCETNQQCATAPLVYAMDLSSSDKSIHDLAHCGGLVLLHAESAVHLLNPATRRTRTLPRSRHHGPPCRGPLGIDMCQEAFGLGHDPRSGAYKVARFSYRSLCTPGSCGGFHSMRMEVFTIGADQQWRETAAQPSCPIVAQQTATFFKGSLIWKTIGDTAPSFFSLSLEDETFRIMQPPPYCASLKYAMSRLAELRGELCLTREAVNIKSIELWMCDNVDKPRWDLRYTIRFSTFKPTEFYPVAAYEDEIVFKQWHGTRRYSLRSIAYKKMFHTQDLRYHNPIACTFGYQRRIFFYFDVISLTFQA